VPFVAAHFNELDSSSTLTSPSCHSARRAWPELQNPLFQKAKDHLLPGEKVPARADKGWGKVLFPALTNRLRRSPLSRKARVNCSIMDSATSPFGSAQNDRVGGILRRVKVFGLEKPTEKKSGIMCIGYGLMLCASVFD